MKFTIIIIFLTIFVYCANTEKKEKVTKPKNIVDVNHPPDTQRVFIFNRKNEPHENAFSILVPKGWIIEGGIFRVNPTTQGGPSQSIAAKLDFSIKKDRTGTVMIRWLPDVLYFDARNSPAGQMGLFPQGSNYQGMTVLNLMSAENFIIEVAFPYAHPYAKNIRIIEKKNLNKISINYAKRIKQAMPYSTMSYDAAIVKVKYTENGKQYEEIIFSIIENWGQLGAGMWGNKETFFVRTPPGNLEKWKPIFGIINNSVKLNINWLIGEIKGQITRGKIAINTQKEIQKIGREIAAHRQKTNAEINNDMFLTLTEQEEYVNPYTNEIEIGTNQWHYRWIDENGDVIYTDNEDYNPNTDINLNRSDFKRSKIRKRFPN